MDIASAINKKSVSLIRVLLVEDSPAEALLLRETLRFVNTSRFEVTHANCMTEALLALRKTEFDVVLLDLGLPESRGLETFLYFHQRAPHVPTIVLSGLDDEDVAVMTVQSGAQDYLVKGRADSDLLVRAMRYAIERKRVQEELRLRNDQFQEDLDLAREFQLAFLPRRYPCFPNDAKPAESALKFCHRYEASHAVGGDFFDILPLSDTQVGIFICDVMGHGLRAALVTAVIRGLVEELKSLATEPSLYLSKINEGLAKVIKQTGSTLFATAFYMVVDIAEGRIRFSCAGHPSPLLFSRDAGTVERIYNGNEPTGAVLGLKGNNLPPAVEKPFHPGDLVLLYTDGVREVTNAADEEFGLARLLDAARRRVHSSPEELLSGIFDESLRYSASGTFEDDVCMVAVEWAKPT